MTSALKTHHRILLTGAAGGLGTALRERLKANCSVLRLSDKNAFGDAQPGEEIALADLADATAVDAAVAGCDAIVHLGGISVEAAWAPILAANIDGLFKLYEAARHHGVKRVVFASSNHVTGFYRQDEVITPQHLPKPDTLYGLSKAFGENLAQLYWHRHGIQTVSIRIGSATTEVADRRMLATWLSHDDLEQLVLRGLSAPVVGHTVVYGLSDNGTRWWDNTSAAHLGYRPQDSSEPQRARVEAQQPVLDPQDPQVIYQGGRFVHLGPFDV